ncbi:MAG: VOC family protein, partial [Gammaproteobacteria bacterium]|nr:VOC family protein [Gammaproteobacteria bacterium]
MSEKTKSRVMGINHVALEVGDIEEALAFYGEFLIFELRSQSENMAFMDLGDQFLALSKGRR